jgi:hypothetical protein
MQLSVSAAPAAQAQASLDTMTLCEITDQEQDARWVVAQSQVRMRELAQRATELQQEAHERKRRAEESARARDLGSTTSRTSSPSSPGVASSRRVFHSLVELPSAINRFIAETNNDPKPVVWTTDPDKIIATVGDERPVGSRAARALARRGHAPGIVVEWASPWRLVLCLLRGEGCKPSAMTHCQSV